MVNSTLSDRLDLSLGVPRGFCSRTASIYLFVNDLSLSVHRCKLVLYADDTAPFYVGKDSHSLHSALQEDLCKLDYWFSANHELIINCTRSKVIFFRFEAELKLVTLHKS